jgi:hypothetical protein
VTESATPPAERSERPSSNAEFYAAFAASLLALVLPLWTSTMLPFLELPQHLAAIRVIHDYEQWEWGFGLFYEVDLTARPLMVYYMAVHWLASVVPIESANRIVLSLYVVAVPLSLASYLRAHGRDPAVALLAGPLAYSVPLFLGFISFVLAIPMLFWALAALRRLMDDHTYRRMAGLTLLTVLLYFTHPQVFALYVPCALITLLAATGGHPRHWWRQAAHLLPGLVFFASWLPGGAETSAAAPAWQVPPVDEMSYGRLLDRFESIPHAMTNAYQGDGDELILLGLFAVCVALFLWREISTTRWLRSRLPELTLLAGATVFFVSPVQWGSLIAVAYRLVPVLALFALATLASHRLPSRRYLLIAPATVLCLATAWMQIRGGNRFDDEAVPGRELLAEAVPASRLLALTYEAEGDVLVTRPYAYFSGYHVFDRGGMAEPSFATGAAMFPIRYRDLVGPPAIRSGIEWAPEQVDLDRALSYFDYFLVRSYDVAATPFNDLLDRVELIRAEGRWRLYRSTGAP